MASIRKNAEYVWRTGAGNQPTLNKSLYIIGTHGVRGIDREDLKRIGNPIIREVRKRMRLLEDANLAEYSRAYQYIKENNLKVSLEGKDTNTIKHELVEAYNFLHTKTSTVEGTIKYREWLNRTMGGEVSAENSLMIWRLVHSFESTNPEKFINYGYDEAIKIISKVAKKTGYDKEETERIVRDIFNNNFEDDEQYDLDEESRSVWMRRGGSSMKDF